MHAPALHSPAIELEKETIVVLKFPTAHVGRASLLTHFRRPALNGNTKNPAAQKVRIDEIDAPLRV